MALSKAAISQKPQSIKKKKTGWTKSKLKTLPMKTLSVIK